jgi:hypothetical protein
MRGTDRDLDLYSVTLTYLKKIRGQLAGARSQGADIATPSARRPGRTGGHVTTRSRDPASPHTSASPRSPLSTPNTQSVKEYYLDSDDS